MAHHLRAQGVGPEALVGILMERSFEMLVALVGILKAGGAYVPLDPDYPPERISFMLEDASVAVLLTQQHLLEKLPAMRGQVIALDAEWENIARQSVENPTNIAMPGQPRLRYLYLRLDGQAEGRRHRTS